MIWEIFEILEKLGIVFLVFSSIRSRLFTCKYKGEKIEVPRDEQKEAFRRSAIAEISRMEGGKRLDISVNWRGNTLHIEENKND